MRLYIPLILVGLAVVIRVHVTCYYKSVGCEQKQSREETIFKIPRQKILEGFQKNLPSPHSELLAGMVLGVDELKKDPAFSQQLRNTSTIHVVVVSGFNISLVFDMVIRILGSRYRLKNLLIAQFLTFLYSLFTGFEPPVIRAWVMGSIVSWGKYYGRNLDALRVLIFAALVMILISPSFLFSLSFQLSFMATLGLISLGNIFKALNFPDDLGSTLSAQLAVWPLISINFGTVSLIGLVVNPLILWTVSISTILGAFTAVFSLLPGFLAYLPSLLVYPFLDIFIRVVEYFGKLGWGSIIFEITLWWLIIYYLVIFISAIYFNKKIKSKSELQKTNSRNTNVLPDSFWVDAITTSTK